MTDLWSKEYICSTFVKEAEHQCTHKKAYIHCINRGLSIRPEIKNMRMEMDLSYYQHSSTRGSPEIVYPQALAKMHVHTVGKRCSSQFTGDSVPLGVDQDACTHTVGKRKEKKRKRLQARTQFPFIKKRQKSQVFQQRIAKKSSISVPLSCKHAQFSVLQLVYRH